MAQSRVLIRTNSFTTLLCFPPKTMASPLQPLALLLLHLLATTVTALRTCSDPTSNYNVPIFHIYGKCSPFTSPANTHSWLDTVVGMAEKDSSRLAYLSSLAVSAHRTSVPIAPGKQIMQIANYVVRVKLGTPAQTMHMVFDTSSDSAWVPCSPCSGCPSTSTSFSPSNSTTYSTMDCAAPMCAQIEGAAQCPTTEPTTCTFAQSYGGDTKFSASLSCDCLTLGADVIPGYSFGCVNTVTGRATSFPKQGLLGLGRGPTSLLSQTASLYKGLFSYCLPSFRSYYFSGSLRLGPAGQPTKIKTTPLLHNPHRSSLYYVNLTGISIGKRLVPVQPEFLNFNPTTGAGTVVDSGTVISRFVEPLYCALRDEFRRQVGASEYSSLGGFDTCFEKTVDGPTVPRVTLHFTGMKLVLPMENTLIHSSARPLACLGMAASPKNVNSVLNVIANLQQQNHRVLIDVPNARVGFARELCN